MGKKIDSRVYSREYFLSDNCEGYHEHVTQKDLSFIKKKQFALIHPKKGDRILDVGCGRGEFLYHCYQKGASVIGIDYSRDAIELSSELFNGLDKTRYKFIHCDITSEVLRGQFDKIIAADIIEHLSPDDGEKMLQKCLSVLCPGGILLIHTAPNTWFTKITYPVIRPLLSLLQQTTAIKQMGRSMSIAAHVHLNEFNYISFLRMIRRISSSCCTYKIWLSEDILRGGVSNYTKELSRSLFFRAIGTILGAWPLRYFFSNDLFAIIYKKI